MSDLTVIQIAAIVADARRHYYRGEPIMSDADYDALEHDLKKLDPDNPVLKTVGAPADNTLSKVKHRCLMGSLDNAFEESEIKAWHAKVNKMTGGKVNWLVIQPKMDGLSVNLHYEDGVLIHAATRGDGKEGEDVTASVMKARGVPRTLPAKVNFDVRCEAMLTKKRFAAHFKAEGYSNERNAAAGTIRRKDATKTEHLLLYAFDVQSHGVVPPDVAERLKFEDTSVELLKEWGFNTVGTARIESDADGLVLNWHAWLSARDGLAYGVDGIVVKVNNRKLQDSCGWSDTCPRGCQALKWRGQMVAETEILGVHNSIGHVGIITPVAKVKPVECGGVTIENVSLMNWDEVGRIEVASAKTLGIGAIVKIERAGDVIPRVVGIVAQSSGPRLQPPASCPSCGTPTVMDGPRCTCPNTEKCPGQLFGKVMRWVKGRNILHLGESTVQALMKASGGPVANAADLYKLDVSDLAKATGSLVVARKVFASLEKSRDCTLTQLFGNLGIPGIGESEADKVVLYLKAVEADDVLVVEDKKLIAAIGDAKGRMFSNGLTAMNEIIEELACGVSPLLRIAQPVKADPSKATPEWSGKSFCATGASEIARATLIKIITDAGGTWKGSVVKGLNYLIMADPDSNTVKAKDARAKGVVCISEAQALKWAGLK